jgi:hypothetical protein
MQWGSLMSFCSPQLLWGSVAVTARVGFLAGVPLDSGRPSDPSLALGIVRVLRELEVASGFSGPSLALGIVRVLRE